MLWMGKWVHPYAVIHVQVGVNLRENGVWPVIGHGNRIRYG